MIKKSAFVALFFCCLSFNSFSANCRSGNAAELGSKSGYEKAKKAAAAWADRENKASDRLQDCLSRIRKTNVSLPSFPSLADILNKISEEICQAAVDKVNDYIPGDIDPWKEYMRR